MKAIFLKEAMYRGKKYNKNDIVDMSQKEFYAFKEFNVVDYAIKYNIDSKKKLIDMSYRELQKICKDKNLYAVGTKEELVERLKHQEGA